VTLKDDRDRTPLDVASEEAVSLLLLAPSPDALRESLRAGGHPIGCCRHPLTRTWRLPVRMQMKKVLERMSLKKRDNVGREVGARRAHLAKMIDARMTGELTEIEFEHQVCIGSIFENLCPETLYSAPFTLSSLPP